MTAIGISCLWKKNICVGLGFGIFGPDTNLQDKTAVIDIKAGKPSGVSYLVNDELDAISCTTPLNCMAVGHGVRKQEVGVISVIKNGRVAGDSIVTGSSWLYGISCWSKKVCEGSGLVDTSSSGATAAVTFSVRNGKAGGAGRVPGSSNLVAISCAGKGICLATGTNTNTLGSQKGVVYSIISK